MSKRIQIVHQDTTLGVLDQISTKGTRSRFVDQAVSHYVASQGRKNLREKLKAGYRTNALRDLTAITEWFPLEEESGRILEPPGEQESKTTVRK